ncbi:PREDICTED: uncharacterized protein LOC108778188 [Cyphomyrmex costatus]|uniref:uncharacterized protein LOC108778188 n=1 Tax=Cyphomyrmex costatus TaxID=456900 RepID=UPI0008523CAD|nr:PREDICTED: uncharacterized protein LOC108778188 [Cyphomyrmex costatus]
MKFLAWNNSWTSWKQDALFLALYLAQPQSIYQIIHSHSKQQSVKQSSKQFQAHVGTENSTCPICQNTHKIFQCLIFRDMSVQARLEKVKSSRLCYNCLKPFHGKKCTYGSCKKCYKHHNTLLHNDKTADSNTLPLEADKGSSTAKQNVLSSVGAKSDKADGPKDDSYSVNNFLSSYHTRHSTLTVLLSIAVVHVRDRHRNLRECRALLDSGLQPNFISQELSECLELPQQNTDVIVRGVNNVSSTPQYETTATICSRFNKYQETLSFLVVDKVTGNLPPISINVNSFQIPSNIKLADPAFHTPGKIDLILGSEVFWRMYQAWQDLAHQSRPVVRSHLAHCEDLQQQVGKFWQLEELPPTQHLITEEQTCEKHFSETHLRAEDGRFIVQLPLKGTHMQLGDSYDAAKRRLITLERRLSKQPELKLQYDSFMQKYIDLGHMKHVPASSQEPEDDYRTYYAVITTSCCSQARQFDPIEEIQTYELQTVTYEEACSAFLAIRCLHQAAEDSQHQFPRAAEIIKSDFYVDNLLTGDDNINNLQEIRKEVTAILQSAKFELHKWKSNCTFLDNVNRGEATFELCGSTKILGQLWDTQLDTFHYTAALSEKLRRLTKRQVLSYTSQIFDPLGLIEPVITQAKILLQRIWQAKLAWDESLPSQLHTQWTAWYGKISCLNHLRIPRRVLCDNPVRVELHGFCDASEQAYGACTYIRSTDSNQCHHVRLLCTKSRVAPLKTVSLPRLELYAALLLSRLYQRVIESLNLNLDNTHFWSDSIITLSWIAGEPSRWATFVANRTAEIQELSTNAKWHHIRSELNPADFISRGMNPDEIQNCNLWWKGPSILYDNYDEAIYNSPQLLRPEETPEIKRQVIVSFVAPEERIDIISRFSSLSRLRRTVAYCFRFAYNSKHKTQQGELKFTGPLQVQELERSMQALLLMAQGDEFNEEIHQLTQKREISSKSKILSLSSFIDTNGLLRVGGRLQEASLDYHQKHPIILPKKHHFTSLIIMQEHLKNMHAGPQALLSIIREILAFVRTKRFGSTLLTFEELSTVIAQVETILNSRPLTPMSTDPSDLQALTSGHFLIGRPLVAITEADLTDISTNRLYRYQLLERMKQTFWKRWSSEYLTQLQQRNKWKRVQVTIKIGTVVVLRNANTPLMNWRIGKSSSIAFWKR